MNVYIKRKVSLKGIRILLSQIFVLFGRCFKNAHIQKRRCCKSTVFRKTN